MYLKNGSERFIAEIYRDESGQTVWIPVTFLLWKNRSLEILRAKNDVSIASLTQFRASLLFKTIFLVLPLTFLLFGSIFYLAPLPLMKWYQQNYLFYFLIGVAMCCLAIFPGALFIVSQALRHRRRLESEGLIQKIEGPLRLINLRNFKKEIFLQTAPLIISLGVLFYVASLDRIGWTIIKLGGPLIFVYFLVLGVQALNHVIYIKKLRTYSV